MNKIWEAINTGNLQALSQELEQLTKELKADNDKAEKCYTDSERLAAYEILLAEIRNILLTPYEQMSNFPQVVIDMIDEEMDK